MAATTRLRVLRMERSAICSPAWDVNRLRVDGRTHNVVVICMNRCQAGRCHCRLLSPTLHILTLIRIKRCVGREICCPFSPCSRALIQRSNSEHIHKCVVDFVMDHGCIARKCHIHRKDATGQVQVIITFVFKVCCESLLFLYTSYCVFPPTLASIQTTGTKILNASEQVRSPCWIRTTDSVCTMYYLVYLYVV